MKASLVNWLPWSVLKMSGRPLLSASSRTSTEKSESRACPGHDRGVFESHQESTYRLYQSMMTTRYRNPLDMGI